MYNDKRIPESQLISILADKSNETYGFKILYDMYAGALLGAISGIIPDVLEAEAVLQECLIKIWAFRKTYNPDKGRPFTWMLQIARMHAIDSYRSKNIPRYNIIYDFRGDAGITNSNGDSQIKNTHINSLKTLKDKLGKNLFDVLDMIYFKGFKCAEAATMLDLATSTVKKRLRQALKELRKDILKRIDEHNC